ncbi:MAG: FecR domain-containing protein [Proteobacteria bacterium]|nr:FecR domain-containing protein [Pseudomonadota bacterium]
MDANERRRQAAADAAEWWVRMQSTELSGTQRGEFVDWLRESPVHVAEMLRIAQVHAALDQFQHWTRISLTPPATERTAEVIPLRPGRQTDDVSPRATIPSRWQRTARAMAVAASVALVLVGASFLQERVFGKLIATERAERREVVLRDGSVVQVDPETRLRIKFSESSRDVHLEHGRALFRVAKNARRPFYVHSEDTVVRAVGTAFGVEQHGSATIVTVAEGKVAVSSEHRREAAAADPQSTLVPVDSSARPTGVRTAGSRPAHPAAVDDESAQIAMLTANQQVTVGESGSAQPVKAVDSHRELAWAEGRLIFRNDPVTHVIAEFNRYNRVQLSVADDKLANRSVSGVFNASEPEAFIAFLQTVAPVEIIHTGETAITIAPAAQTGK